MKTAINKVAIALITLNLSSTPTLSMMNIDTEGAGKAAAELLIPIITPIAQDLIGNITNKVQQAVNGLSRDNICKVQCSSGSSKVVCGGRKRTSFCLNRCSKKIDVGSGFYLLIRYREKTDRKGEQKQWDMRRCVALALEKDESPKKIAKGKSIFKGEKLPEGTIAIYGRENLNTALELIANIIELDKFALSNGKAAREKGVPAEKIAGLVTEAKREALLLRKNLKDYIDADHFGPQYGLL